MVDRRQFTQYRLFAGARMLSGRANIPAAPEGGVAVRTHERALDGHAAGGLIAFKGIRYAEIDLGSPVPATGSGKDIDRDPAGGSLR